MKKLTGLAKKSLINKSFKKNNKVISKQAVAMESKLLHETWDRYVDKLMSSKKVNKEVKSIQKNFSDEIFNGLTDIEDTNTLNAYSYKVFVSNSLEYICKCKKEASNIFIVTYMFRTLANLLDRCKVIDLEDDLDVDFIEYVNENILDILDTTKNTKLIFALLSENMDGNIYNDQLFMIS